VTSPVAAVLLRAAERLDDLEDAERSLRSREQDVRSAEWDLLQAERRRDEAAEVCAALREAAGKAEGARAVAQVRAEGGGGVTATGAITEIDVDGLLDDRGIRYIGKAILRPRPVFRIGRDARRLTR